jgi:hypothetical protein
MPGHPLLRLLFDPVVIHVRGSFLCFLPPFCGFVLLVVVSLFHCLRLFYALGHPFTWDFAGLKHRLLYMVIGACGVEMGCQLVKGHSLNLLIPSLSALTTRDRIFSNDDTCHWSHTISKQFILILSVWLKASRCAHMG